MKPTIAFPWIKEGLLRMYMLSKYVHSLRRSGARVCPINLANPEKALELVMKCDGLVLPGGTDINPELYGQVRSEKCQKPEVGRDAAEWKILENWMTTGRPVLCICRGVQLMNVFFGGTLHQDIAHIQQQNHNDFKGRGKGVHKVRVTPGTALAEILEEEWITVNSIHHQAVDAKGRDLTVAAVSEDGFVEALELPGHRFCMGVQWHPEHLSSKDPLQQKLFDEFVACCRKK